MSLKGAVVGVGYLGRFHAQKYKVLEEVELVAVCDPNEERAKEVAKELNVDWYTDPSQLIGKINVATIASTTQTHYEIAKLFLENNINVMVEKPICSTVEQARNLCELADKKKLKLQVGHIERFNPALIGVKEKLNKPWFIEVHRLAPFKARGHDVDVVLDLMIHDIDVVFSLVNSPVKEVRAVGVPVITNEVDIANARIEFENGTVANLTASRVSQGAQRKFRVFQENQYLSIDFGSGEVALTTKTGDYQDGKLPLEYENWNLEKDDAMLLETRSFFQSVINNTACEVSGEDGLRALELAEEISGQAAICRGN